MDQRYKEKHAKGKRWTARRRKTRIWSRREGDSVVYIHRNRRNGKIYIGYSTRACYDRWTYTEYKKSGEHSHFYRALTKEKELYEQAGIQSTDRLVGFESRILVDGLSLELAKEVERFTIAFLKERGCELYNGTGGGDGGPIMKGDANPTKRPEVRAKKSKAMIDHYKKHPEAREATSIGVKKYYENHPEAREAMSERFKNHPELNPNPPKPVEAVDPETGLLVYFFESATSADEFGFNHRNISACCNRKTGYKTHKGYIWRFVEKEE